MTRRKRYGKKDRPQGEKTKTRLRTGLARLIEKKKLSVQITVKELVDDVDIKPFDILSALFGYYRLF